jgi:tetratricopeptide (TPR) repeat protein/glycosyltransferase involved in cell wall biosynthesis
MSTKNYDFLRLDATATVTEALQLAVQHHRANRLDQAQECYRHVLIEQPDQLEALHGLSTLAQQTGEFHSAEQFLKAALQMQPSSVKSWFSLGNLHLSQGAFSSSVQAYRQTLALQPDSAPIYNNLGYALQQLGQWDSAIASYQRALELEPNCVEADVNLGNALHKQGKLLPEKEAHYADLNHKLAVVREQAGDLKTAEAYYRQALELVPNQGELYFNLGKIYQQQKNFQQAIAAYREGLKLLNPRYAEAIAAYPGVETTQEAPVTPPIIPGEVTVGAYQFPAIPTVADPQNPRPFWTVVIPVYNRTEYLLECLVSLLVQWPGFEEMEILLMDNASTLPVFEIVNSLGGGVIRYYRHPQNIGALPNHNAGIALSRGQWIHILHDDDCVLPGFYSHLKQSLEGCSDSIGAAFTGFEYFNEKGEVCEKGDVVSWFGERRGIPEDFLLRIGVTCPLQVPAVVIRRATHERLGAYHPELACAPEWELYKRIAVFSDWWYEPGSLARYRVHSQRMTNDDFLSGNLAAYIRQGIEISESYLPADQRSKITLQARSYNFNYCLARAAIPLKAGNIAGALRMLQEILKLDRSLPAVAKLFAWLTQDQAAPLREEIVSKILSR